MGGENRKTFDAIDVALFSLGQRRFHGCIFQPHRILVKHPSASVTDALPAITPEPFAISGAG
jgi:hypothetical protein